MLTDKKIDGGSLWSGISVMASRFLIANSPQPRCVKHWPTPSVFLSSRPLFGLRLRNNCKCHLEIPDPRSAKLPMCRSKNPTMPSPSPWPKKPRNGTKSMVQICCVEVIFIILIIMTMIEIMIMIMIWEEIGWMCWVPRWRRLAAETLLQCHALLYIVWHCIALHCIPLLCFALLVLCCVARLFPPTDTF